MAVTSCLGQWGRETGHCSGPRRAGAALGAPGTPLGPSSFPFICVFRRPLAPSSCAPTHSKAAGHTETDGFASALAVAALVRANTETQGYCLNVQAGSQLRQIGRANPPELGSQAAHEGRGVANAFLSTKSVSKAALLNSPVQELSVRSDRYPENRLSHRCSLRTSTNLFGSLGRFILSRWDHCGCSPLPPACATSRADHHTR
jgi:hypothetical protein